MKNNCHLVHGFNVRDGGAGTTDKLIPLVESLGLNPVQHDYGWLDFFGVLRKNKDIALEIKEQLVDHDDIGIGHSNGCPILVKALLQGAKFSVLILINPALDKNYEFPGDVKEIHVFHNDNDLAVVGAKWLRKSVFWRDDFLWGEMGNTGYQGGDSRVTNHAFANGHSDVFSSRMISDLFVKVSLIINKAKLHGKS
jgi:hypothetical protein